MHTGKGEGASREGRGLREGRGSQRRGSVACLPLLTLHLKHCGDGSVFSNGNSSFFFICCVEHLLCPGMLTDTGAANPPGQPDPALVSLCCPGESSWPWAHGSVDSGWFSGADLGLSPGGEHLHRSWVSRRKRVQCGSNCFRAPGGCMWWCKDDLLVGEVGWVWTTWVSVEAQWGN